MDCGLGGTGGDVCGVSVIRGLGGVGDRVVEAVAVGADVVGTEVVETGVVAGCVGGCVAPVVRSIVESDA